MAMKKWLEDDIIKQNKFDILLKNSEPCWLFMVIY
jgi:hypothetical protein